MGLSSLKLKKILKFQKGSYKARKSKMSCTFLYKEEKVSKLKYFPIIIIKLFFPIL